MSTIRLILGRTLARRRRAVTRADDVDVLGRPTTCWVVASPAQQVENGDPSGRRRQFSPTVKVWSPWIAELWDRHGDGRARIDGPGLTLAARYVLQIHQRRWPGLVRIGIGPELATQLATVTEQVPRHGTDRVGDRELDDARRALLRHLATRRDHVRSSEVERLLIAALADPDPALQRTLSAHPVVVFEGLFPRDPLSCRLAVALARAMWRVGVEVVFGLAWGRDRGGREAGIALGWDEGDPQAQQEARTFEASRPLRQALFELVEEGAATVEIASGTDTTEVHPWTETGPAAPEDVADHLAAGTSIPVVGPTGARHALGSGRIRLFACTDEAEEAATMARGLKDRLRRGADPTDCLVAVAHLAASRSAIEAALVDAGIPYQIDSRTSVGRLPVGGAVIMAMTIAVRGPTPATACALAAHLDLDLPTDPRSLRRALAGAGIRPGAGIATWRAALRGWIVRNRVPTDEADDLVATLREVRSLVQRCVPLGRGDDIAGWGPRTIATLADLGLLAACRHADEVRAWGTVVRAIEGLARDLTMIHPRRWPPTVLLEQLELTLGAPLPDDEALDGRVRVADLEAVTDLHPRYAWFLGLNRGSVPTPTPMAFAIPFSWRRRTSPDPLALPRYLLSARIRGVLDTPDAALTLSWSAGRTGRTLRPAAILTDLLDLPTAGDDTFGDLAVQAPPRDPPPVGRVDAWRLAAADRDWLALLPDALAPHFPPQADAHADRQGPLGPRDGILQRPEAPPEALSVTAMETYLKCPQRYWYANVLGLARRDAWAPELEARRRGTALHRILEAFLLRRSLAPLSGEDPRTLAPVLHTVASEILDEVEAQGGFDPVFQAYARNRWLAGLVDDAPGGILEAWLRQECTGSPHRIPVGVEVPFEGLAVGNIELRGILDRLDELEGGALVVTDYKTGRPPSRKLVSLGLALQPYAYAEAVARDAPGIPVAASFLSLARPDALRRTGWVGDRASLDAGCSTPTERSRAILLEEDGRQQVLDRAGVAAANLVAGRFPTSHLGPELAGCRTCPHARACRVDHPRQAEQLGWNDL